ncbi:MAG: response regulator transcription factor [Candidatus Kapabacteria bacterium]|nr:response regulator transcription factor [Candidatus Kapabacteria bacterium]
MDIRKYEARIFLVDDHEVVRHGLEMSLTNFLEEHPHLEIEISFVGAAKTGEEALAYLPASGANVVLMDIALPDMSGIEIIRRLRESGYSKEQLHILVVTELASPNIREIFAVGANGYLDKQEDSSVFIEALFSILRDPLRSWMQPTVAQQLMKVDFAIKAYQLTRQEIEVLQHIHLSNPEISEVLNISTGTIRTHLSNIYDKLNVPSRKDAFEIARRLGLVSSV